MSELHEYEVDSPNGGTYTVQLTAEDAKTRGLTAKTKAAKAPANKARATDAKD